MITSEEWQKLKVGDVVYFVHDQDIKLFTCEIESIGKSKVHFFDGYCSKDDEQLFTSKLEALKEYRDVLIDEQEHFNEKIRSVESEIEQLESLENGN